MSVPAGSVGRRPSPEAMLAICTWDRPTPICNSTCVRMPFRSVVSKDLQSVPKRWEVPYS